VPTIEAKNCQMIASTTITSMTSMILRTVPLIALPFGFARLKAVLTFGRPGFHAGDELAGQVGPPESGVPDSP
jgi:hypothetical protein